MLIACHARRLTWTWETTIDPVGTAFIVPNSVIGERHFNWLSVEYVQAECIKMLFLLASVEKRTNVYAVHYMQSGYFSIKNKLFTSCSHTYFLPPKTESQPDWVSAGASIHQVGHHLISSIRHALE